MWARINNGTVAETTDIDPVGRYAEDLVWHQTNETVDVGWLFDGNTFTAPTPVSIPANTLISPLKFMGRFTTAESNAIASAATTAPQVLIWMLKTAAAKEIELTDQLTIDGLEELVTAGLITEQRKAAILTA